MKTITAYIRLANEEKTILSCLDSIDRVFDKILILHSDISDSSLNLVEWYSKSHQNIKIIQYPYTVYHQGSELYFKKYDKNHSLAAYYEYGLQFIETDYWMKIDADQIYFTDQLIYYLNLIRIDYKSNNYYDMHGYNGNIINNTIGINKKDPINGLTDHMVIPNDTNIKYIQSVEYEKIILPSYLWHNKYCNTYPCWVHLRDAYKFSKLPTNTINHSDKILPFNKQHISAYKKYVLPLLQYHNSPYQYLKIL